MHRYVLIAALVGLTMSSRPARADGNDIVLARLGTVVGTGNNMRAVGDNLAFRSVVSELGVVLAPRLLAPADTLGFGGFQFTVDMGFTTIHSDQDYWRVRESSPDPTGMAGMDHGGGIVRTTGIFMRKGMWLPLPSFELGVGAVHLADSNIWTGQVYAKFSLHEGYHGWPIPSLAVRGAGSRMMGSQDIDLTVVSLDVSMSKSIGLGGTVNFEPYLGGNMLIIIPRSEVVDRTPHIAGDRAFNFVFNDQADILRNRVFGGFKLQHHVFAILLEANYALAGSSVDDRAGTLACTDPAAAPDTCDATDQAGLQQTYTVSLGMDF